VEFRILGQVELWAESTRYDLGPRKARSVLALLLCELGHPIPAETLVTRIWGDESSDSALKSLYESVSRLRKSLRAAGGSGRELVHRSGSYVLDVSRHDVDAWRFRVLRDQARATSARGDNERAIHLLTEADALWRGVPLDGLDGDWAEGARVRLNEERFAATLLRIGAGLQLGRHADLIGETADLTRRHPFDEALLDLHLRALHGSGRKAEALSAYRNAERRWREGYGGELGSALRDLHQLMLHDDPTLSATPPWGASRAVITDAVLPSAPSSTMPRDNPDFTGRAAELSTLTSWLNSHEARSSVPVVVISGMAGVGKTTLAVHLAHQLRERYPEQVFVRLWANDADEAPLNSAAALGRLLRRLGVPDTVIPADSEERAALLRYKLTGRNALILLDDALDAAQVMPLLPGIPGCVVLVTTRRRTLILPGMLSIPLDPMPHADAAMLFSRIAGLSVRTASDQAPVSRLVRLCGHVPLRIQLAGRQLQVHPAWSVGDLVSRFGDPGSGERDMIAQLDLSYRYLTAAQQRLFRWLALHPGDSFSAHAAVAMAGDASPALTEYALEALLDYHLIEESIPGRYEFHAVLREYAESLSNQVDSQQDRRVALGRLLRYYLGLLEQADRMAHPSRSRITAVDGAIRPALPPLTTPRECAELLDVEKTNLLAIARYAGSQGWSREAAMFAHLLAGFLDTWGDWADAIDLHRRAVSAWHVTGNTSGEAAALVDLGFILCRTGQLAEAAEHLRTALAIAQATGDTTGQAAALNTMGIIQVWSDQYEESLASHDQALARWRELGDRHGEADALSHSVLPAKRLGRHQDALSRAERALAVYRELGDPDGETKVLNNLGGLQQDAGCYEDALVSYEQAMARSTEIGNRQGEAITLSNIGDIRRLSGHYQEALQDYRAALSIFREIGDRGSAVETISGMAAAFAHAGDNREALGQYEKALALATDLAERHAQATAHLGIGAVRLAMGQYLTAADDYRAALKLSQEIADPVQEGHAHYGLGCALLETEGAGAAVSQWREALALFEATGRPEADDLRARLPPATGDLGSRTDETQLRSE
jgi:tetratricopeptide (TPR) repeat protein/DNA-binding SARP family transcriptional activator